MDILILEKQVVSLLAVLCLCCGTSCYVMDVDCQLNGFESSHMNYRLPNGDYRTLYWTAKKTHIAFSSGRCYEDPDTGIILPCTGLCLNKNDSDDPIKELKCQRWCAIYHQCHKVPQPIGHAEMCAGVFPDDFSEPSPMSDDTEGLEPENHGIVKPAHPQPHPTRTADGAEGVKVGVSVGGFLVVAAVVVGVVMIVIRRRRRDTPPPPDGPGANHGMVPLADAQAGDDDQNAAVVNDPLLDPARPAAGPRHDQARDNNPQVSCRLPDEDGEPVEDNIDDIDSAAVQDESDIPDVVIGH